MAGNHPPAEDRRKRVLYDPYYHPTAPNAAAFRSPSFPAQAQAQWVPPPPPGGRGRGRGYDDFSVYENVHILKPQMMQLPHPPSSSSSSTSPAPYITRHAYFSTSYRRVQEDTTPPNRAIPVQDQRIPSDNLIETRIINSNFVQSFSLASPF